MNCLSLNCRGAGNKPTVREIVGLVRSTKANMVFLCETRQKAEKMRRLRGRLGLKGFTCLDSEGRSGGLAMFWSENLHVEVQEVTTRYIDMFLRLSPQQPLWHLTCVYGEPRVENQHNMWSQLQKLKVQNSLPRCVLGDFNAALWSFEHLSVKPRAERQMVAFRDTLEICELVDLGFSGPAYTYDNRRHGSANVQVRLDRAVADNDWRNLFPESRVVHKVTPCSDHCMILLECKKEEQTGPRPTRKSMRLCGRGIRVYQREWPTPGLMPGRKRPSVISVVG
jgi:hypothetical protein